MQSHSEGVEACARQLEPPVSVYLLPSVGLLVKIAVL